MNENLWIQIIVYAVTMLVASLRFGFLIGRIEANCVTRVELKDKVKERDEKIQSVFHALDLHKDECKADYVRKDMCGQMHQYSKEEISKLDKDYRDFRHEIRNTVQKTFDLIDGLGVRINELKNEHNSKISELKELISALRK